MARSYFMRLGKNQTLLPADPATAEDIDAALREGQMYRVEVTEAEGGDRTLSKWMAGIGVAHFNLSEEDRERWPTPNKLSEMFLIALGHSHKEHIKLNRDSADGTSFQIVADSKRQMVKDGTFGEFFELSRALAVKLWGYDPWQKWESGYRVPRSR